ncbi:MAG TPA: hypothetical protein VE288_00240 [Rubrobacteraceae bacterium]|jgi:amino acid transporter|nr:hypothetical protein [Rubrobacteraceae bacterium]
MRTRHHPPVPNPRATKGLGLLAAVSIGVGGMIGAGIFSVLGVVATVSGTALPLSFLIGGAIASLAAYSYTKLGVRYPSVGGAVQFLVEGFGDGLVSGAINIFQYFGFIIAIALYAEIQTTILCLLRCFIIKVSILGNLMSFETPGGNPLPIYN